MDSCPKHNIAENVSIFCIRDVNAMNSKCPENDDKKYISAVADMLMKDICDVETDAGNRSIAHEEHAEYLQNNDCIDVDEVSVKQKKESIGSGVGFGDIYEEVIKLIHCFSQNKLCWRFAIRKLQI